jgi:branched-chain amino acid transport system ATP-binding protein
MWFQRPSNVRKQLTSTGVGVATGEQLLVLENLQVHYGRIPALRGVSLWVGRGEMVGVVGPNGAGKSTMMFAISGMLKPTIGSIRLDATSLIGRSPEEIARRGISLVPERRHIFAQLTVQENLRVATSLRGGPRETARDFERLYERFPVLWERRGTRAGNLSGGQQQQLAIARALLMRPRLLLVDEPSLGLAPLMIERVFDSLLTLPAEGVSVLLVEQNALMTIELCDRIYMLRGGQIRLEGSGKDPRDRVALVNSYMDQLGLRVGSDDASMIQ